MQAWEDLVSVIKNPLDHLTVHVVGKYVGYEDSYKSLNEALYHGGFPHRLKVHIKWIEAEALEAPDGLSLLDESDGILVPGGFGDRGTRGMMQAAQIARERGIPFFGICYGFQWATVEYARNVAGLADADSTECRPETPTKLIYKLRDLLGVDELGGHDAAGLLCVRADARLAGCARLRRKPHPRAPPPPLRVQLPVRADVDGARAAHLGPIARRQVRRDRGAARIIRGTSPCSSTQSSSRSRRGRIPCSRPSSRPATSTRPPTACTARPQRLRQWHEASPRLTALPDSEGGSLWISALDFRHRLIVRLFSLSSLKFQLPALA